MPGLLAMTSCGKDWNRVSAECLPCLPDDPTSRRTQLNGSLPERSSYDGVIVCFVFFFFKQLKSTKRSSAVQLLDKVTTGLLQKPHTVLATCALAEAKEDGNWTAFYCSISE